MTADFAIEAEQLGGRHVLAVAGDVQPDATRDFERALLTAVGRAAEHIVVDLTRASALEPSFLVALEATAKWLRTRGRQISLVCEEPTLLEAIERAGLDRVAGLYRSIDAVPDAGRAA